LGDVKYDYKYGVIMVNIKMIHIFLLYDALREGSVNIDTISVSKRDKHMAALDLENLGFFKNIKSKGYNMRFKLTKYGRKYITEYDKEIRKDEYSPSYVPEFMNI
jgi:hypothetical protein